MLQAMTPFFGTNRYKFGLFGANCGGGMTLSSAPERWRAEWDEIVRLYQLADEAGIEFILPIAKWRGLGGGAADMWGRSYETFTHSAAAGALTKHIGVFVTAHVPIITPAFAAKAITTIDHVTHGRVGLNIVCGWNPDEFNIHGAAIDGARRYDQGLEWFKIYAEDFGRRRAVRLERGILSAARSCYRPTAGAAAAAAGDVRRRLRHRPTFCRAGGRHPVYLSSRSGAGTRGGAHGQGRRGQIPA